MRLFEQRKTTLFEKALMILGLAVLVIGFLVINSLFRLDGGLTWLALIAMFLWLIILLLMILASSSQDIKEEISILISKSNEELRLLRTEFQQLNKRGVRK
ncbi:hypothetical protein J4464_06140 [Candidatus Woesearchaeota archaeon]|nr:hypothetical protein [Candidatus Woesearchaeota archaeon]